MARGQAELVILSSWACSSGEAVLAFRRTPPRCGEFSGFLWFRSPSLFTALLVSPAASSSPSDPLGTWKGSWCHLLSFHQGAQCHLLSAHWGGLCHLCHLRRQPCDTCRHFTPLAPGCAVTRRTHGLPAPSLSVSLPRAGLGSG